VDAADAVAGEPEELVLDEGASGDGDEGFGEVGVEGGDAGAGAAEENDGLESDE
jgi:hypothetical protein